MRVLRLLCFVLAVINLTLAQCPWHKDVPDLQTACLCAYNLGHELSVQCDQVCEMHQLFIARTLNSFSNSCESFKTVAFFILAPSFALIISLILFFFSSVFFSRFFFFLLQFH